MSNNRKAEPKVGTRGIRAALFLFLLLGILLSGLPAQEEDEEVAEFKGAGIHVRLGGGYTLLSGGDFDAGIGGIYDWWGQNIASGGYTLRESHRSPLRSGFELGGDIVYYFADGLGIGAGGSLTKVNKTSEHRYIYGAALLDYSMTVVPQINIVTFRLGLFYALPINRLLTLSFNAGPALYSVDYKLSVNIQGAGYIHSTTQKAEARKFGLQGGIGLEIRMNQRVAFILEAQGRYAKISGFDGKEQLYESLRGVVNSDETNGLVYYLGKEGHPWLMISETAPTTGTSVREAAFDFSGVSFRAGLNFKF